MNYLTSSFLTRSWAASAHHRTFLCLHEHTNLPNEETALKKNKKKLDLGFNFLFFQNVLVLHVNTQSSF